MKTEYSTELGIAVWESTGCWPDSVLLGKQILDTVMALDIPYKLDIINSFNNNYNKKAINYMQYRLLDEVELMDIGDEWLNDDNKWEPVNWSTVGRVSKIHVRRPDDGKGTWLLLNVGGLINPNDEAYTEGIWQVIGSMLPVTENYENIREYAKHLIRHKRVVATTKNKK